MPEPIYQFAGVLVTGFRLTGRRTGRGIRISLRTQTEQLDVEEARRLHEALERWLNDREPAS